MGGHISDAMDVCSRSGIRSHMAMTPQNIFYDSKGEGSFRLGPLIGVETLGNMAGGWDRQGSKGEEKGKGEGKELVFGNRYNWTLEEQVKALGDILMGVMSEQEMGELGATFRLVCSRALSLDGKERPHLYKFQEIMNKESFKMQVLGESERAEKLVDALTQPKNMHHYTTQVDYIYIYIYIEYRDYHKLFK